jgi:hypothetical protein
MTPHYGQGGVESIAQRSLLLKAPQITHAWRRGRYSVREQVENKACLQEHVLEHGDDLEGEHVLSAIVPDLEDCSLPDVVFRLLCFTVIAIIIEVDLFFADFEGCHEWCLCNSSGP